MDHHVLEQTSGPFDVGCRRWRGIPRGDLHQLHRSDAAAVDVVAEAPERRVEATVETDHQRHPATGRRGHGAPRPGEIQVDGFLAEDRLARLGRLSDQFGVKVGGGGDEHTLDGHIAQHLVDGHGAGAGHLRHRCCSGLVGIGYRRQPRPLAVGDGARVSPSDPAGPQQPQPDGVVRHLESRWKIQSWSGWFLNRHWRFGPAITFR